MKTNYSNQLIDLLQIRPRLKKSHGLEFKNCFGAVVGYVKGRIFISCGKFGIALKLPPKIISGLLKESGVKQLKYFTRGHIKKDYVVLPSRIFEDEVTFGKLISESIRFVTSAKSTGK